MQPRSFPVSLLVLITFIAVTNWLAEVYFWYWRMRWFDIPMHFLGGVWLAAAFLWWKYARKGNPLPHFTKILGASLIAAVGIGLIWEVIQAGLGLETVGHASRMSGTIKDLFFDTLGGITVAVWVGVRSQNNIHK